jgi:predicted secreted protein
MKKVLIIISLIIFALCNEEFRKFSLAKIEENSYLPMKVGQKIIIEVEGNPTTGYVWMVNNRESIKTNGIISALNLNENGTAEFFNAPSEVVGASGLYQFKFEALGKQGYEAVEFVHKRPWEDVANAIKKVNIHVVNPDSQGTDL